MQEKGRAKKGSSLAEIKRGHCFTVKGTIRSGGGGKKISRGGVNNVSFPQGN